MTTCYQLWKDNHIVGFSRGEYFLGATAEQWTKTPVEFDTKIKLTTLPMGIEHLPVEGEPNERRKRIRTIV